MLAAIALLLAVACGDDSVEPQAARTATPESEAEVGAASANPAGWPRRAGHPGEIAGDTDFVLITGELRREGFAELAGYALKGDEITSPGPTIRLRAGEEVTVTLENVHGRFDEESIAHDFVVVAEQDELAEPLWGAAIGTEDPNLRRYIPLEPGARGSVTFTPDTEGSFFYICSVPGHASSHGMWGRFIVE
ncbi:MAG: multicopper oxidase domain-containing protein [Actinomycetota bacterium]